MNSTDYIMSFSTENLPQESTEVIVVGSGVAGLRAALTASEEYSVTIVTKGKIRSSNTWIAQGGIAAVLQGDDSYESHIEDTLKAGDGLCDRDAVKKLVKQGAREVEQLIEWGADFDRVEGELDYGREGGHSHSRIVHGRGDATGSLVEDTLVEQVRLNPKITVIEECMVLDLLADEERFYGTILRKETQKKILWGRALVLASGGGGQIFRETTNHSVATGDGFALALRSGLNLKNLEFVQFHPTTLYVAGGPRFLISEALRGEGAILLDDEGNRFMEEVHAMGELAPRDIVSRAILRRMIQTETECVYLDITKLSSEELSAKFPTIYDKCSEYGINMGEDLIPVRPCAHYYMGGVRSSMDGVTSLENLFVAGEVACTGAHGANRLASNSLLEGLVMGSLLQEPISDGLPELERLKMSYSTSERGVELDIDDLTRSLKSIMWRKVGILRNESGLQEALQQIEHWMKLTDGYNTQTRDVCELKNMLQVCFTVTKSALFRTESRGAHFREDYPEGDKNLRYNTLIDGKTWKPNASPISK